LKINIYRCVRKDFEKAFKEAGETGVITLEVENTSYPVLVHHLSYNQLGDTVRAIDFYAVNLKEKHKPKSHPLNWGISSSKRIEWYFGKKRLKKLK
jgi:hypothetical protein